MTEEQLRNGHSTLQAIWRLEKINEALKKAVVRVDRASTGMYINQIEYDIELLPEEQETLNSLQDAYLEVLRTANTRNLTRVKKEFEDL